MSSLHVEVLERTEADPYEALFAATPNAFIQQSLRWADVIAHLGPDHPYFLLARDATSGKALAGIPLYKFSGAFGSILTSVPQAGPLGGIFFSPSSLSEAPQQDIYRQLYLAACSLAEREGCLALTIITDPMREDALAYEQISPPAFALRNFTQITDLDKLLPTPDAINAGKARFNNDIRRNLAKASETGIEVDWAERPSSAPELFDQWYSLHQKRHGELNAPPLPKTLLQHLLDHLGEQQVSGSAAAGLAIARIGSRLLGGAIFIWHRWVADAFIMSSDSEYLSQGVNYALTAFAARDLHARGARWLNWQSSASRSSGVYAFKERWHSSEHRYSFLTWTFPGFETLLAQPLPALRAAYPWHYVAPFPALQSRATSGVYEKG